MKKFICLILASFILLLTACSPKEPGTTTTPSTPTTETFPAQGIQNLIIIIGDGMGDSHIEAGELYAGKNFSFTSWEHTMVDTSSLSNKPTDSAASATALATGELTYNGHVGQDADGKNLKTIFDYAIESGKSTGAITTDKAYAATLGGFSSHATSRHNYDDILQTQFQSDITLICSDYTTEAMDKHADIKNAGYTLSTSFYDVANSLTAPKNYWLLGLSDYDAYDKLTKVSALALEYLSQDPDGFVLMIEQADIDKHAHRNEFNGIPQCANVLNDTVDTILQWVGDREDTAILVTADHETGGLQLSDAPNLPNFFPCTNGDKIYYEFSSTEHTGSYVSLYVYGYQPNFSKYYTSEHPDAIKNTNIFDMMLDLLQNPTHGRD